MTILRFILRNSLHLAVIAEIVALKILFTILFQKNYVDFVVLLTACLILMLNIYGSLQQYNDLIYVFTITHQVPV